jgi:hypothetical protein
MAALPEKVERFVRHAEHVEAVLQRLGAGSYDLVFFDDRGNWERAVLPTEALARSICESLQVPVRDGWDDPELAQRVNGLDAWSTPGAKRRAT